MRIGLVIGVVLALGACSSVKQYSGPERKPSEIAIVSKAEGAPLTVNSIDGNFRGLGDLLRLDFLPGRHTLGIHWVNGTDGGGLEYSSVPIMLAFDVQAGRTYEIKAKAGTGQSWTAWIEDTATKEVVSQVVK